MKRGHLLALILMNLLWAATYPSFKWIAPYLDAAQIVTLRFTLASLGLAVVWPWLPGPAPSGRDLARAILMGIIVFTAAPRLQVEGVHRGHAGDSAILVALEPLITTLAAAIFLRERIPGRRWAGFCLSIAGMLLLARVWRPEYQPVKGLLAYLLFISSFLCETAYSVMGKPLLRRVSIGKLVAIALFSGTSVNWLISGRPTWSAARALPSSAWFLLLYLALVCTVGGYILWYVVIRETEVNLIALTVFIQPLAGLLISVFLLGESLHAGHFWGSAAILAGLLVGIQPAPTARTAPPPPN